MIHYKIFDNFDHRLLKDLKELRKFYLFNVFQIPEWIETIINNSQNFENIKIIFVYSDSKIILVIPLFIKNIYGCKELRWISSDIIDYNNAIILELFDFEDLEFKNIWKKITDDLFSQCDLIFFYKIPEFIKFKKNPLINSDYKSYQKSYQLIL